MGVMIHTIPEVPLTMDAQTPLRGTPDELAEARRPRGRGIDHVQLWIEPITPGGIAGFAPVLELLERR
jgi:hypothetical protein